jgi:uncharacterized protein
MSLRIRPRPTLLLALLCALAPAGCDRETEGDATVLDDAARGAPSTLARPEDPRSAMLRGTPLLSGEAAPYFDCDPADVASVRALICRNDGLALLDRRLAEAWTAGLEKRGSAGAEPAALEALRREQAEWLGYRDDCWASRDVSVCTRLRYLERIAEVQVAFELVASGGPEQWRCGESAEPTFVLTVFDTDPRAARIERGDRTGIVRVVRSPGGTKWGGEGGSFFWARGDVARAWWPATTTDTLDCRLDGAIDFRPRPGRESGAPR